MAPVPKVFVSYSWDNESHKSWVCELATRLRDEGIDVKLDKWHTVPGDQLTVFMEKAIRESDFVLIICTPNYQQKSDARIGGVGYEGDIITGEMLTGQSRGKFIPILRDGEWVSAAPCWLYAKYYIDLRGDPYSEDNYRELLTTLHGNRLPAPVIGNTPNLSDREGKRMTAVVAFGLYHSSAGQCEKLLTNSLSHSKDEIRKIALQAIASMGSLAENAQASLVEGMEVVLCNSPSEAFDFARAIHYAVAAYNRSKNDEIPLSFRVGIAWGTVLVGRTDVSGAAIRHSREILRSCGPGEVLATEDLVNRLEARTKVLFGQPEVMDVGSYERITVYRYLVADSPLGISERHDDRLSFPQIRVPDSYPKGCMSNTRLGHYPFSTPCHIYFGFNLVNPLFDVTLLNNDDASVLIKEVGIEICEVAETDDLIGAKIQVDEVVKPQGLVVLTLPDVWSVLEQRGTPYLPEKGLSPQMLGLRVYAELPDSVFLQGRQPYRFLFGLNRFLAHMPPDSIIRLLVRTNRGLALSPRLHVAIPTNRFHAKCKKDAKGQKYVVIARSFHFSDLFTWADDELCKQADNFFQGRQFTQAKSTVQEAIKVLEQFVPDTHDSLASMLHNLGVVTYQLGEFAEASMHYARAKRVLEKVEGSSEDELRRCRRDLELAYSSELDNDMKRHLFADALRTAEDLIGASGNQEDTAKLLNACGILCYRSEAYQEAERFFARAHAIRKDCLGHQHKDVAISLNNLGSALREQGKFDMADQCYLDAIRIAEALGDYGYVSTVLTFRAKLLRRIGRNQEADQLERRAAQLNQNGENESQRD